MFKLSSWTSTEVPAKRHVDHALYVGAGWSLRDLVAVSKLGPLLENEQRYYRASADLPADVVGLGQTRIETQWLSSVLTLFCVGRCMCQTCPMSVEKQQTASRGDWR